GLLRCPPVAHALGAPKTRDVSCGNSTMDATRQSLLLRARTGDAVAWEHLVGLYRPFIRQWLDRQAIAAHHGDDLPPDGVLILYQKLPGFEHAGRPGSFRSWLRTIARNRAYEFWRAGRCRVQTPGGSSFLEVLQQLDDPNSAPSREWDAEHDRALCRRLLG